MEAETSTLYADTIKLDIAEIEAGLTNHTTTPYAKKESAEIETALKDILKPANILHSIIPVVTEINVPMHTLLVEVV